MIICCANGDSIDYEQNNHMSNDNNSNNVDKRKLARIDAQAAKDDPKYASIINFFAIIVIIVCTFFLGFYS